MLKSKGKIVLHNRDAANIYLENWTGEYWISTTLHPLLLLFLLNSNFLEMCCHLEL